MVQVRPVAGVIVAVTVGRLAPAMIEAGEEAVIVTGIAVMVNVTGIALAVLWLASL